MELLCMKPVMKEMIWGGNRMRNEYGYELPGEKTGECWAISAHPNGDCEVYVRCDEASVNGPVYAAAEGKKLSELWQTNREFFGGLEGEVFPLLTKIIDAAADLSIQVHPDNAYAAAHEVTADGRPALGKTECWYILDCDPDATIVIGHHAQNKEELRKMVEEGRFTELIREIPVHPGDFFQINPGCVHAIKGGTLLLETQQSSDVTYRLYDYGRLQNGKPRELHLQKSMDVIVCPMEQTEDAADRRIVFGTGEGSYIERLVSCPYYTVERLVVKDALPMESFRNEANATFDILSVIHGEGKIGSILVKKGEHVIIPAGQKNAMLTGEMELIHAKP